MRFGIGALCVAVAAVCSASSAACQQRHPPRRASPVLPADSIARLAVGRGMNDHTRIVVRDSATWLALRPQLYPAGGAAPQPAVDFARYMLIVAGAGAQSSLQVVVRADTIYEASGHLRVVVTTSRVGEDCLTASAYDWPTLVLRVPRRSQVVFDERSEVWKACRPEHPLPPGARRRPAG